MDMEVKHRPTAEQSACIEAVLTTQDNLMIRALAGTGKSATLRMADDACPIGPALYLVFNTRNAKEATKKFRPSTTVQTFNSCGHRTWMTTCARTVALNQRKTSDIFRQLLENAGRTDAEEAWEVWDCVKDGVKKAKAVGYIPATHQRAVKRLASWDDLKAKMDEQPGPLAKEYIDAIMLESIRQAYLGSIDFDDQCYMPALVGGIFPRFPRIMVDEYQDLSPVQHHMISRLCRYGARQIGVGDEAQAIYAFRGAYDNGMADAIEKFQMKVLPLSVSFRCPSAIVENVLWRVPEFRAHKTGGSVNYGGEPRDDATVICRNNAPLLSMAMRLLCEGQSVDVAGVDMAERLVGQMKKLGPEEMTRGEALREIDDWLLRKIEVGSKSAPDMADCMRVFVRKSPSLGAAIAYANHMFAQAGKVSFLTGHKSKGLEFQDVYHLEPTLCTDRGQDQNVHYVIDTRSLDSLTYIRTPDVST